MTDINSKKNVLQLQKLVIDGLEDVKAQDIKVFNTENLSPLFERVIIASGTSNRQTKALASSVRDVVREAGYAKPRVEGEENGEWIIVDCGAVVAHIMQPAIRQYYHLEEIWGEKPVRIKHGEDKMSELIKEKAAKPAHADKSAKGGKSTKTSGTKDVIKNKKDKSNTASKARKDGGSSPAQDRAVSKPSSVKTAPRKSSTSTTPKTSTSKTSAGKLTKAGGTAKSDKSAKSDKTRTTKADASSSVAKTLSSARTKSASAKSKSGSSAPSVKTRNSPPRA